MLRSLLNSFIKSGFIPHKILVKRYEKKNSVKIAIEKRRVELGIEFYKRFDSTIQYGLFKGLKLGTEPTWGGFSDKSAQLFGIYEQEVLDFISNLDELTNVFINLGAADGYYAIGMLASKKAVKSYAYETDEKSREIMKENALINQVQERLEVRGEAVQDFYKDFTAEELNRSLILSDIEGAEFKVFNRDTFSNLSKSNIIIELHDWIFPVSESLLNELIANSSATHYASIVQTSARDLAKFKELQDLCDNDRWIICSEGRPKLMSWLMLKPIFT